MEVSAEGAEVTASWEAGGENDCQVPGAEARGDRLAAGRRRRGKRQAEADKRQSAKIQADVANKALAKAKPKAKPNPETKSKPKKAKPKKAESKKVKAKAKPKSSGPSPAKLKPRTQLELKPGWTQGPSGPSRSST